MSSLLTDANPGATLDCVPWFICIDSSSYVDDPLMPDIARMYKTDRAQFVKTAQVSIVLNSELPMS